MEWGVLENPPAALGDGPRRELQLHRRRPDLEGGQAVTRRTVLSAGFGGETYGRYSEGVEGRRAVGSRSGARTGPRRGGGGDVRLMRVGAVMASPAGVAVGRVAIAGFEREGAAAAWRDAPARGDPRGAARRHGPVIGWRGGLVTGSLGWAVGEAVGGGGAAFVVAGACAAASWRRGAGADGGRAGCSRAREQLVVIPARRRRSLLGSLHNGTTMLAWADRRRSVNAHTSSRNTRRGDGGRGSGRRAALGVGKDPLP